MPATVTATNTFQIGTSYYARSAGDYNCIWTFEVIARTARFITIREDDRTGTVRRVRVNWAVDSVEYALPFGTYSMSPAIRATRPVVASEVTA